MESGLSASREKDFANNAGDRNVSVLERILPEDDMMKKILVFAAFSLLVAWPALSQSAEDLKAIEKTARDYVEGWQAGDTERVARAVSTELAKRQVVTRSGVSFVSPMGCSLLLAATAGNKAGVRAKDLTPDQPFKLEVKILDIDGANASVKAWNAKYGFFDYMHMAKINNEWKIVNVLWDTIAAPAAN
jgi:hypothetical protein